MNYRCAFSNWILKKVLMNSANPKSRIMAEEVFCRYMMRLSVSFRRMASARNTLQKSILSTKAKHTPNITKRYQLEVLAVAVTAPNHMMMTAGLMVLIRNPLDHILK